MGGDGKREGRKGVGEWKEERVWKEERSNRERIHPLCNFLDPLMSTRHDDYVCKYNVPASEP